MVSDFEAYLWSHLKFDASQSHVEELLFFRLKSDVTRIVRYVYDGYTNAYGYPPF